MTRLAALNSGGIDSPVAMHHFLRHGIDMISVIFDNQPFSTPDSVSTARETVSILENTHGTTIPTYVVPHGFVQETFLNDASEDDLKYNCLFSRRLMLKTAARLTAKTDASGLVTGESLGQVASQTLENLQVTDAAVQTRVYRPLIGFDKTQIVDTAREIGTFDTSSQGGIACAAHIEYPETRGVKQEMERIENNFNTDELIQEALDRAGKTVT